MKKLLPTLTGLLTAVALLAPAASMAQTKSKLTQILERGTLRVGTTGDFNPMSIKDTATNTFTGFDVEAMTQLAADMGVKVEFVPAEWATLVNGIVSDRFDIFSGASLSMARARTVAFSTPYLYAGTVPMSSKKAPAKFATWESINNPNVTVAVLMGTVFEQQARAHFPKARIRAVEKPATGYQEVLAGRAQVTITSNVEAATLMKTYPDMQIVGGTEMRNKRPFAYPLPQGDEVWLTFVNNWISLKQAEGYFDVLEAKWLTAKK